MATTTQSWTYDSTNCHLGLICSESYPRISGTFPVNYTYSFGLPTAITAGRCGVNGEILYWLRSRQDLEPSGKAA